MNFNNWIITIKSKNPWPTLSLVACTHWDEIVWYKVFEYLFNDFKIESKLNFWKINFIIWNIKAFWEWKRFIDKDFNRIWDFKDEDKNTYEYKRALEIKDILVDSDYVFDLHSTTNPSPFFLIPLNNSNTSFFKWFQVDFVVKDLLNFLHWVPLISYVNKKNNNAECMVMECFLSNDSDLDVAIKNVLYYLSYYWFIKDYQFFDTKKQPKILKTKEVIKAQSFDVEFIYSKKPESFQKIKHWELILKDNNKDYFAPFDCYILMPTKPRYIWEEIWYLLVED